MKFLAAVFAATIVNTAAAASSAEQPATVPAPIPVERFADRPELGDATIAPNGKLMAFTSQASGSTQLVVIDLDTRKAVARANISSDLDYNWYRWAGSGVILVSVGKIEKVAGDETRVTRLVGFNLETGQQWMVGPRSMGAEGDDLLWVARDGSSALLSFQKSIYDWPSVHRVSLRDPEDRGTQVQSPVDGIWEWYADDAGEVRLGAGLSNGKIRITYRPNPAEKYRVIGKVEADSDNALLGISRIPAGSDIAYAFDSAEDGRTALVRYDLLKGQTVDVVYRDAAWDLSTALLDESGKPIAVDYTDERDRRVWLDPALGRLQGDLEKALKAEEVWIRSRSDGGTRMLVDAGGESDPGVLYLYDAGKKSLDEITPYRPKLDVAALARPKPITYTARDGTKIAGFLTLPIGRDPHGLPLIVLPHGGPYGVRDKLAYDDEVQFLANRGYAVLQPNYRGSDGYGDKFSDLGIGQIGRGMQDDIDDAMDWAVAQGIADKGRVCVVGASYGGYAAMWAALRNPERYRCAASFAGVTDWKRILRYDAKFLSFKGTRKWSARVIGEEKFDLDSVAPAQAIGQLKVPLLVAHGRKDTRVPFSQFQLIAASAKRAGVNIDTLIFDDEGHGFDKPADEARWYSTLEAFLTKHNPA